MNKKAIIMGKVVTAIILIVALVVFIVYLAKIGLSAVSIAENTECKASIVAHTAMLKITDENIAPDIYCPTQYYKIPTKDQEEIKEYIAESMKTCWGMWGRGELQLFKGDGYFCHMCSVMEFKHKDIQVTGLNDYLISTPISKGGGNLGGITYADYLTGHSTNRASPEFIEQVKKNTAIDTIDTSKDYATMFIFAKGEDSMQKFFEGIDSLYQKKKSTAGWSTYYGSAGGATAGIVTVAVIGATGGAAAVVIGAGALLGAAAGAIIDALKNKGVDWTAMVMFEEYDAETLKQIGCERSEAKQDKQEEALG